MASESFCGTMVNDPQVVLDFEQRCYPVAGSFPVPCGLSSGHLWSGLGNTHLQFSAELFEAEGAVSTMA